MFGRKNGCRYFIDSENVNEVWVNILNILKPEDMIFLFYTDNSAHISCAKAVELINIGAKQIKGIRCKEGNNGLDFQMVTQLGAVISKSPKCEYILVSNDNGFDAVVSYWKQKGYNIRREKSSFCVSLQISDPAKPAANQKKNTNSNRKQISGQRSQNRPRLENKKEYKKQPPKLEDKKQQTAERKPSAGKASENKKVVDLEAKKAKKMEEKKQREKGREEEAIREEKRLTAEAVPEQNQTAMESVPIREATETEPIREEPIREAMESNTEPEEAAQGHDDFEPMEKPMVIPDTAMVADGTRLIDTRYCLQSLCTMISRKNMALFHNALTCIFEQKDGDEIYAAVKSHPELHTQLWSRYEQDREERIHSYLRLLLDVNDYEVQDTDLLYQVYRETYDGSLQGLNIGIMKAFGDETGVKYYRLLRKHINILTKL